MRFHDVQKIQFEGQEMILGVDGKEYSVDLRLVSNRLALAGESARRHFSVSPSGYGVYWPEIDEDLSIDSLINQIPRKSNKIAHSIGVQNASDNLTSHLRRIIDHVEQTEEQFRKLTDCGIRTVPIPYFGDIEQAEILTVGLNPSSGEFEKHRNWPLGKVDAKSLAARLQNYFRLGHPPRHPWFDPWEESLGMLNGSSYRIRAAHLDLCPRATVNKPAVDEFLEMLEIDLPFFSQSLAFCRNAKVLLMAGTVTNKYYINEFLQMPSRRRGFELHGNFRRRPGGRMTSTHTLEFKGRNLRLPVFFFSSSPSNFRNREALVQLVSQRRKEICTCLN